MKNIKLLKYPAFFRSGYLYFFFLWAMFLICSAAAAQEKNLVQIKTFDQQLKPLKGIEISVNGKEFVSVGNKGEAFVELNEHDLPVKSIKVKNDQLETASWHYSKGVIEVIIRKKTYHAFSFVVRGSDQQAVANVKVIFNGRQSMTVTTSHEGKFEILLPLDEKISAASQFIIQGYNIVKLQLAEGTNVLTADKVIDAKISTEAAVSETPVTRQEYFKDFDLSKLDSIQSLTVFYAIFKNYQMKDMNANAKKKVDAKFNQLVQKLEDSVRRSGVAFIGRISDSSFVRDDIKNLLEQATLESQTLQLQRSDFDEKIALINEKLATGMENLDGDMRARLLADITRLEYLLTQNENRFYRNQNDYRQIINSLKEKFFDLEDLENKLSVSEAQRLEEQRVFRLRLFITLSIAVVFAVLIILLVYFSNKLKKQKQELILANAEVKRINENLEGLVYQRTKSLEEAHKELDTFLYRASHDLRSPVCSIIGLCNLASHFSGGEAKDIMDKVVDTTVAMDRLLKKLTIISEINQPSDFSTINLHETAERISHNFKKIIVENRIEFVINCPADMVIYSYPNLIDAILTNLIENALFYTAIKNQSKGEVRLSAVIKGDHLELSLHDNGIGVDQKIRDKVFNMFFKGHAFAKGNGLGLYIVQKSAQALNGSVSVESEFGSFTKFSVSLPLKSAPVESLHKVKEEEVYALN
jgi:signal transduction histidine kinase